MLVELLRPLGVERARRWLAALLLVPFAERDDVVHAVESRIVATYGRAHSPTVGDQAPATDTDPLDDFTLISPPTQKPGYVEQVERTYTRGRDAAASPKADANSAPKTRRRRAQ